MVPQIKSNHHFVPRFYLRAFQCAPKRISLYNWKRDLTVRYASIADQCCRRWFYGDDDAAENALGDFESEAARIIRNIAASETLPTHTGDWVGLFTFVALQGLRTQAAAARSIEAFDKMARHLLTSEPSLTDADVASIRVTSKHPVLLSLSSLPHVATALSTLDLQLVVSEEGRFITSDNPVFQYNHYCESLVDASAAAPGRSGFQLFVPLTPRLQLVMFDSDVYRVPSTPDRKSKRTIATARDVNELNGLQVVGAEEQVFFSDWSQRHYVRELAERLSGKRVTDPVKVEEFFQDDDSHSSLLRVFRRLPRLKLDLSFLRVTRSARAVPHLDRFRRFRAAVTVPDLPTPPSLKNRESVRFSRRDGRKRF